MQRLCQSTLKFFCTGFNDDPENEKKVICLACTDRSGHKPASKMLRTSISTHRHSTSHIHNLETWKALRNSGVRAINPVWTRRGVPQQPVTPAELSLADEFQSSSEDEEDGEDTSRAPSPVYQNWQDIELDCRDEDGNDIIFHIDELVDEEARFRANVERLTRTSHAQFGCDDLGADNEEEVPDVLTSALNQLGLIYSFSRCLLSFMDCLDLEDSDESDREEAVLPEKESCTKGPWAPHGSRTVSMPLGFCFAGVDSRCQMFFLDLLDNLPRLQLSDELLKTILWIMEECGTPDVPSFSRLRKLQEELTRHAAVKPEKHVSALGNIFYMNSPAKLLALVSLVANLKASVAEIFASRTGRTQRSAI